MYLDGPGGCGKTFTYNYLSAALNAQGHKVATSVWTASDGRTVHSFFKPVPIFDTSCFNISPASAFAANCQLCRGASVPLHSWQSINSVIACQ